MKENDTKRMSDMKTSTKSILSLLVAIISIFTGIALANGENVTNVTIDPNTTVTNVTNATIDPNITMPMPTPVITPNVTIDPNVTAPISTPVITSNVTADVTPNITVTPIVTVSIPAPVMAPNITIVPAVTVSTQTPAVSPNVTVGANTTIVSAPLTDQNVTQWKISKVVPEILDTPEPIHTSKQRRGSTQTAVPITITVVPANGYNRKGFLGDIYDKIIIAAMLGLVGLCYEIIKIKYEHKQKAKLERINEDTQNKLLEKLERRQEKLLAQHGISDKRQDEPLDKPEKQQEDINDKNKNV